MSQQRKDSELELNFSDEYNEEKNSENENKQTENQQKQDSDCMSQVLDDENSSDENQKQNQKIQQKNIEKQKPNIQKQIQKPKEKPKEKKPHKSPKKTQQKSSQEPNKQKQFPQNPVAPQQKKKESVNSISSSQQQPQDPDNDVRNHYEKQEPMQIITRQNLETSDLRNFHNWIKSVIISKYAKESQQIIQKEEDLTTCQNQLYVLEIGCGKGGDLKKWLHADIAFYIGVDIAINSLKEAQRRAIKMMETPQQKKFNKNKFRYGFFQKDGSSQSEEFWKNIISETYQNDFRKSIYFDIVSCQMCMHYMFSSQQNARNFFHNATSKLNINGFLLLTFSDSNAIVKKMRQYSQKNQENEQVYSNKYFSMKFKTLDFPVNNGYYGLKYDFYLQDSVGEKDSNGKIKYVPEYLVEINNLIELAFDYGLEPVENANFIDFYKQYRNQYKDLLKKMNFEFSTEHPQIDPDLWEVSHCYRVMVFKKIPTQKNKNRFRFHRNYTFKQIKQASDGGPLAFNPSKSAQFTQNKWMNE